MDVVAEAGVLADVTDWGEALAEADVPDVATFEPAPPEAVAPEAVAPLPALATGAVDAPPASPQLDPAAPPSRRSAAATTKREPAKREPAKRRPPEARPRTKAQPSGTGSRTASTRAGGKSPGSALARRAKPGKAAAKAVALVPSCPYCAMQLEPPPTSSRSCPRCRHRIVVKRIEGRVVYLTEAAVAFFEAERRRIAGAARFTRERARWLKLAAAAGAPPERAARLVAAQLSEETVDAARALYMTTVERAFRSAKRERRWDDASRIRREQAMALFRVPGSGSIPSEALVTLHREGVAAELRGLAEIAKEAELVSAACCDACRADDGRIVRIAQELLAPRLPHAGCIKSLCRCRWDMTARDRTNLRRYQRRPARANPRANERAVPAAPQPAV
jgi:DNA-directed RNA polymerase subunit RPC12/RpoP